MDQARRERFEREILSHMQAVHSSAWRLTGDGDAARDLAQDALLRAYRAFDGYTAGTNARAWLLTIVYSVFVNEYRRRRRAPVQVSIDGLEERYAGALAAPPAEALAVESAWTTVAVEQAMNELPDAFRETVWLVDVEELSYEETATVMGCAVGTVKSRLFRARRLLAAALQEHARARGVVRGVRGER